MMAGSEDMVSIFVYRLWQMVASVAACYLIVYVFFN